MTPFPPQLPTSLDNHGSIRENDWSAAIQIAAFKNHWDRPGWTNGRSSYHWFFTFEDDTLKRQSIEILATFDKFHFDPVPSNRLHLTILRAGFVDQIPRSAIPELLDNAAVQLTDNSFDLMVGPLAMSTGAIRYTVAPWQPLHAIYNRLAAATTKSTGAQYPTAADKFRPHLSIAYSNRPQPAGPIQDAIATHRTISPLHIRVSAVHLVQLRREGAAYVWDTIGTIDLPG